MATVIILKCIFLFYLYFKQAEPFENYMSSVTIKLRLVKQNNKIHFQVKIKKIYLVINKQIKI